MRWQFGASDYLFRQRYFQTPNPPDGMIIRYCLKNATSSPARVLITNARGEEVARLEDSANAGINTVVWNARLRPAGAGGRRGATPGRGRATVLESPGAGRDYTVTVDVAGRSLTRKATIAQTQGWKLGPSP